MRLEEGAGRTLAVAFLLVIAVLVLVAGLSVGWPEAGAVALMWSASPPLGGAAVVLRRLSRRVRRSAGAARSHPRSAGTTS